MGFADRLSLRTVATDYWRSVRKHGDGSPDYGALTLVFGLPVAFAGVSVGFGLKLTNPTSLLPAVALLAGVLLAAAGQVLTMRARIADSLTLSTDSRVTKHVRETMSGLLLAACAALVDALLLGILAGIQPNPVTAPSAQGVPPNEVMVANSGLAIMLTAAIVLVTTYVSLMFVATARRLYATYLEVFENGAPLAKHRSRSAYEVRLEKIERKKRVTNGHQ